MSDPIRFRISVSDLAEFCCRRGDLNLGLERSPTAQEGQQGQRQLQRNRPDHYQKEFSVRDEWITQHFTCVVSGRIDGVQLDEIPLLEEIKTTYCQRSTLPAAQQAVHWAQLQLYGALFLQEHTFDSLQLQLRYSNLDDETEFSIEETLPRESLSAFYESCRHEYQQWLQWQWEHWQRRNHWLHSLAFPFATYRDGQRKLSVQAYRNLRDGGRGLYQAATGLGKTSGILFPALKALTESAIRQIWYVTAKNSGQRSVIQALEQLQRQQDAPLRVLFLNARERICFCESQTTAPCHWQLGFYDKWHDIRNTLQQSSSWQQEHLITMAQSQVMCPHQLALQLLPWADLIVADYNYVFDPNVRLGDYLEQTAGNCVLLVDEAHNLPERARDMFSERLTLPTVQRAADYVTEPQLQRRIKRLLRHFPAPFTAPTVTPSAPDPLQQELTILMDTWLEWFARQQWLVYPVEHFDVLMACLRFSRRLQRWQAEDRFIAHGENETPTLEIFCTDPAPQLDQLTQRFHGCLYFSGSLQPLNFFARALSREPFAHALELPSPFPAAHQLTLIVPINTRYHARADSIVSVVSIIKTVWNSKPGRYLVSFPSYHYLQTTAQHLMEADPDLPLIMQSSAKGSLPTAEFVARLTAAPGVALVIAGGSYAEGLDLPDNLLQGVIIIGTCMPPPSLTRELIKQQYEQAGCNGFDFAFRFPGLNRVIQSAGRVIRNETDRGVVVLVDDRFNRPDNRNPLPAHWQPAVVPTPQDLRAPLLAFWQADL